MPGVFTGISFIILCPLMLFMAVLTLPRIYYNCPFTMMSCLENYQNNDHARLLLLQLTLVLLITDAWCKCRDAWDIPLESLKVPGLHGTHEELMEAPAARKCDTSCHANRDQILCEH